jgi:hypothetical protein
MELKPEIEQAFTEDERRTVKMALAELTALANGPQVRWRVTQLKNALLVKSAEDMTDD